MSRRRILSIIDKKDWHAKAVKAMSQGATITEAAKFAGVDRTTLYRHMDADPDFKKQIDDATEEGTDVLETEATRRAVTGLDEPVIYQGQVTFIGIDKDGNSCDPKSSLAVKHIPLTVRKPSDTLMIFMLKARRPTKFRDNAVIEHTGPKGGPVETIAKQPMNTESFVKELARELERSAIEGGAVERNGNGQSVHSDNANGEASRIPNR